MYTKVALFLAKTAIVLVMGLQGCKKNVEQKTLSQENVRESWLLSGRITHEDFAHGEIIALSTQGDQFLAPIREDNSFAFNLPANKTFLIYFLSETALSDSIEKETISNNPLNKALLTFEEDAETGMRDTLRLPSATAIGALDLGTIEIRGEFAYPSTSPASKLDYDHDGIPDSFDFDDENDGLRDVSQKTRHEPILLCHHEEHTLSTEYPLLLSHLEHHDKIGTCEKKYDDNKAIIGENSSASHEENKASSTSSPAPVQIHEPLIIEEDPHYRPTDGSTQHVPVHSFDSQN